MMDHDFRLILLLRLILKTVKYVTYGPPVHTKTAHILPADLKTVDFENGTLTGTF